MSNLQEIEKFKTFCVENFGMSSHEDAFQTRQSGDDLVFKSIETIRLFHTWSRLEQISKKFTLSLNKYDYTREKLDKWEDENKLSHLEGYYAGKEPYTNWVVFCGCCAQIVKSIKTQLGAECPEELKKYKEPSNV